MNLKARLAIFAAIVVLAAIGGAIYVLRAEREQTHAAGLPPQVPVTVGDWASVATKPHIVFRNTATGTGYGQVALVPLDASDGPRTLTPASCDRVYATAQQAVCLFAKRAMVTTYHAQVLGPNWTPIRDLPLSGIPSRTRLSKDGSLVATTTFVHGHSYASPGEFSTETLVSKSDGSHTDNVESFTLNVDGTQITAEDRNIWGVTFADHDTFYATAASGKKTWLVRGSLSARALTALRPDAECPSLSPDGTRVAIKTRGNLPPGQWRIAVHDLRTGKSTLLAEARSVDDQIEWLDNTTVIYGLPRSGDGPAATDVWRAPADGTGTPTLLIRDAWSPAVIR
ncbi:hypothetical protein [Allorhizocola rhizosphaerae]|uniref:hypothetical protein n=1 Tax=Allorhizocola rhizosphaerae TaxID=1872709 RepID=UPI000E3D575B|nr:hypothetical protein [Allorhizocola rhizosphaerae]